MQKFAIAIGLLLSILLLTGTSLRAEVDIPRQSIHQEEIYKAVKAANELLAPVDALFNSLVVPNR
jgi:sRNA-binding carbon storage regulator CsrA